MPSNGQRRAAMLMFMNSCTKVLPVNFLYKILSFSAYSVSVFLLWSVAPQLLMQARDTNLRFPFQSNTPQYLTAFKEGFPKAVCKGWCRFVHSCWGTLPSRLNSKSDYCVICLIFLPYQITKYFSIRLWFQYIVLLGSIS